MTEINTIFFNEHFLVSGTSYFDIPINTDILRYIDPNLLGVVHHPLFDSSTAKRKVSEYFYTAFQAYKQGNKELAIELIEYPKEVNAIHFGHSQRYSSGNGPSPEILDQFFSRITEGFGELQNELSSKPILLPLFVKNFGSDRFSDLIACIISKELAEFTEKICAEYGLVLTAVELGRHYNTETQTWEVLHAKLPLDLNQKPILLCPKEIVVKEYGFSANHYVNSVILRQLQTYHYDNETSGLVHLEEVKGVLVKGKPNLKLVREVELNRKYFNPGKIKDFALDYSLESPLALTQYIELLEGKNIFLRKH